MKAINRYLAAALLLGLLVATTTSPASAGRFYPQTGYTLADQFLNFFDANGGLLVFGLPLTEPYNLDGKLIQYTERARLEWDPRTARTAVADLGLELLDGRRFPPVSAAPAGDRLYFPETGHTLANGFLAFWQMHNGREVLGLPLSEEFQEDGLTVQYFQKGRLEYHPDLAGTGWEVQMTDLGRRILQRAGLAGTAQIVSLSSYEQRLLDMVNSARASQGLPLLAPDSSVIQIARSRSSDMGTRGYFGHTTPDGGTFVTLLDAEGIRYSMAGETIARNNYPPEQGPQIAFQGFMGSPAHRQIVLSPSYSRVGVGFYRTPDGMNYFTVIFLQP